MTMISKEEGLIPTPKKKTFYVKTLLAGVFLVGVLLQYFAGGLSGSSWLFMDSSGLTLGGGSEFSVGRDSVQFQSTVALEHKKAWMVVTMQRSGSRWFVDTLASRSNGRIGDVREFKARDNCHCRPVSSTEKLIRAQRKCEEKLQRKLRRQPPNNYPGMKVMAHYDDDDDDAVRGPEAFEVLARSVCALELRYVFLWRRNVLRRIVSVRANEFDKAGDAHVPHPTNEAEAQRLRSYKPRLDPESLLDEIEGELEMQRSLEAAFAANCDIAAQVFYYEDLVENDSNWAEVLKALLWDEEPDLEVIHGDVPVMETMENPHEVQAALNSTKYAWMLAA